MRCISVLCFTYNQKCNLFGVYFFPLSGTRWDYVYHFWTVSQRLNNGNNQSEHQVFCGRQFFICKRTADVYLNISAETILRSFVHVILRWLEGWTTINNINELVRVLMLTKFRSIIDRVLGWLSRLLGFKLWVTVKLAWLCEYLSERARSSK